MIPGHDADLLQGTLAALLRGEAPDVALDGPMLQSLAEAAMQHGIGGLLDRRLVEAGAKDVFQRALRERLTPFVRSQVLEDSLTHLELQRVLRSLAEAGIDSMLFKGAALAYSHYAEPWLRSRSDTDILVREQDVPRAGNILRSLGYQQGHCLTGKLVSQQMAYIRTDPSGARHSLDVHWRLFNRPDLADLVGFDELFESSAPIPALDRGARALGPVHALWLAAVHWVAHHQNRPRLIWMYDIHALIMGMDELAEWVRLARRTKVSAICNTTLCAVQGLLAAPVPDWVLSELSAAGPEPSAAYLGPRWVGDIRLGDFRALPGWRPRLQLVTEVVFPDRAFMMREYRARNPALLPWLYVHRLLRGAWRFGRRMVGPGPGSVGAMTRER
jgi:hypothetical protein